jgi:hypothetical protein
MKITNEIKKILDAVTNKRARFIIDTILMKGYCSTEDLKFAGYEHAPRAARDVRELGIPLVTFRVKDQNGKSIAAYKFGDWDNEKNLYLLDKTKGRTQLTQNLKRKLLDRFGNICHLYGVEYPADLLQPDHRIPYEIAGDPEDINNLDYFMLLSPSANRAKSWACEHCSNWTKRDIDFCRTCYYAFPELYTHIAGKKERKIDLVFNEADIEIGEAIIEQAHMENVTTQDFIKRIVEYYLQTHDKSKENMSLD